MDNHFNWYAIYTKCHHERRVKRFLEIKSLNAFLPLRKALSRRKDRIKIIELPLFPGYLFVESDSKWFAEILKIPGVAYILGYNGVPSPVPEEEINSVKILVDSNAEIDSSSYISEGDSVIIIEGPFKGVSGKLLSNDCSKYKLAVSIELLNQSVVVDLPKEAIEKYL